MAHAYRIENQWQFDQNGTHVQVFAGSLDSDPGQGVIVILTSAGTQVSSTPAAYVTPQKAGAVRIVNASATELQLVAQGGQRFQFDLASRAFVPLTALPQWPSGVFDVGQAPFPAGQPFPANLIDVANVWQMSTSQGFVRVFAGAYKADPAQGVVVIQRVNGALWSEDDTYGGPNTVKASATKDGSLRIVAATQDTVSLIGEDGKAFQLTLASNQLAQP